MARKASGLLSSLGRTFDETATTLAQASVLPLLGFVDAGHEYLCVLKTSSGDDLGSALGRSAGSPGDFAFMMLSERVADWLGATAR